MVYSVLWVMLRIHIINRTVRGFGVQGSELFSEPSCCDFGFGLTKLSPSQMGVSDN